MIYPLLNLRRLKLGVRDLVVALENAVIAYAAELGITASGSRQAPGVYVDGAKLASIGLRIRRGACYHGMALNVSLDPQPFERINVCGYRDLRVTRLADHGVHAGVEAVARYLTPHLLRQLGLGVRKNEPDCSAAGYSAINTDLQAVSSR
jgi:lipoyl(octanoyl) transferase